MRSALLRVAAFLALTFGAGVGHAASFDCARARAADEKAICADRALNDQDVRMATMFGFLHGVHAMGAAGAMGDRQRAWLVQRGQCRADRACLARAYRTRIAELEADYDHLPRPF